MSMIIDDFGCRVSGASSDLLDASCALATHHGGQPLARSIQGVREQHRQGRNTGQVAFMQ
jgi:hypothetical protein